MRDLLAEAIDGSDADYIEARHHAREVLRIGIAKGELEQANYTDYRGVGFRALADGAWGFSSTSKFTKRELRTAASDAVKAARASSRSKSAKVKGLAECKMAKGKFRVKTDGPLEDVSVEEKVKLVVDTEKSARRRERSIKSAVCGYLELIDRKTILNTDGADAEIYESRADFYIQAVASENGKMVSARRSEGVAGGWGDLFRRQSAEEMAGDASKSALQQLKAPHPKGGRAVVILDPSMVGLISHEAVGHTVEADFVLSGSAAKGKMGRRVASRLVTLVDEGVPKLGRSPAGTLMVDDEGVPTKRTIVIDKGVMKSYLHDRETAALFGVAPTGNARAFEYSDEPLVRMRNTYIEPGNWSFDEMVSETKEGYLLMHAGHGQADANAEFMFTSEEAYEIKNGEVGGMLRGTAVSGNAFDVLKSVDAVGKKFSFAMGFGFCGKGQAAKVDGGGGHVRCEAIVGGRQEG